MRLQGLSVDRYTVGSFVNLAKADASPSAVHLARQVFECVWGGDMCVCVCVCAGVCECLLCTGIRV